MGADRGGEPEGLGGLLRRCRRRIAPERTSLGTYLRLPIRVGKAITQDEVAEAVGISRQWYAMLELNRAQGVSAMLLGRIADALMMDAVERAALCRFALPQLHSISLRDESIAVLDAFRSLRSVTRCLWAATTEAEALALIREHTATQLASDTVQTITKVGDGRWDRVTTGDVDRARRYDALVQGRWGAAMVDDLCCYTLMAQPGEVLTRFERDARFPELAAKERPVLTSMGVGDLSFAMANVRSQQGFIARLLAVHYRAHAFSEIERAQLSALADLASLALSGCASSSRRRSRRSPVVTTHRYALPTD